MLFQLLVPRSLTTRRDSPWPVAALWPWWFYSWVVACSRGTVIPRISVVPPVACRGLRPCLHYYLCLSVTTADAVASASPKQQWPTMLTHATASGLLQQLSPASDVKMLQIY